MSFFEAILLGIVQGLTEFLPISSSGHLVLVKALLGIREKGIAFEIFVHFGTLLAVITVYKNDLLLILKDCKLYLSPAYRRNPDPDLVAPPGVRMFGLIVLATVPTAILGLAFQGTFESAFSSTMFVSIALLFTGLLLSLTRIRVRNQYALNPTRALLVGLAQVIAFFPGVSRSGTTITAGLLLGLKPEEAARFSFLIVIPLILGVTLLSCIELIAAPPPAEQVLHFVVGCAAAYISGLWAIKWLVAVVLHGRFARFAYYCFAVGGLGLLMHWLK